MSKVSLEDIRRLFREIIVPFHLIKRDITLPTKDHRADNDAEHSWSLSFLAVSLAPKIDKNLNVGKVAIYAIVHDVWEVYAGDTSVWASEEERASKHDRELAALEKIKKDFPQFPEIAEHIETYDKGDTLEAQFVYALDKFLNMMLIVEDQGYYYHTQHKLTKERVMAQLKDHRAKAHTHPEVAKYYDELRDAFDKNPDNFYKVS